MALHRVLARHLIVGDRVTLTPDGARREHPVASVEILRGDATLRGSVTTVEVTFVGMNPTDLPEQYGYDDYAWVRVNADDVARRLRTLADFLSDDPDRDADVHALLAAARHMVGQA